MICAFILIKAFTSVLKFNRHFKTKEFLILLVNPSTVFSIWVVEMLPFTWLSRESGIYPWQFFLSHISHSICQEIRWLYLSKNFHSLTTLCLQCDFSHDTTHISAITTQLFLPTYFSTLSTLWWWQSKMEATL